MTQKMCEKAVGTYSCTIKFFPECHKTQKMFNKAVNRCFLYLILFLIDIKLKQCVTVVSEDAFLIVYCPNKYITQKMRDKAVDDSLAALNLIPD